MKRLLACLLCLAALPAFAEEAKPDMDFYNQELIVEFASEKAAAAAAIDILPLYRGYEWAITSRWDDNVRTNLKMSAMLIKRGFKGTFYLNAADTKSYYGPDYGYLDAVGGEAEIGRSLVKAGHSVAGHTMEHHWMEALSRTLMWYEVMAIRVNREADIDAPLALFGVGFGFSGNVFDPDEYFHDLEEMQRRSGMYARSSWGLPCDGAEIDDAFAERLKDEEKRKEDPVITYCGHVWYTTTEAWEKFEGQLEKYASNPRWWYCNYNEYRAYRYQYLNSRISCERDGRIVTAKISRPVAIDLGDAVPMTIAVRGVKARAVKAVSCASARVEKVKLATGGRGYDLGHDRDRQLPGKIDAVEDGGGTSAEFPFLSVAIARKGNYLNLMIENTGDMPLTDLRVVYRVPLAWGNGVVVKRLDRLGGGQFYRESIVLKPAHDDYLYMNGKGYYVAQLDFTRAGDVGRLYVTCLDNVEVKDDALPANGFWVMGPLPGSRREAMKLAGEAAKKNRGGRTGWRRVERARTAMLHPEFIFTMGSDRTEIGEYHFLLLTSVRSEKKQKLKVVSYPQAIRAMYLNGKLQRRDTLKFKRGKNSLLLLFNPGSEEMSPLHYGLPFRLVDPDTDQRATNITYLPDEVKFKGVAKMFGGEEAVRKNVVRKLFDDFEDGNFRNLVGAMGIGKTNGDWHFSADEYGESRISVDIAQDKPNSSALALHASGYLGKSVEPKWVHAMVASNLSAAGQNSTIELVGTVGISFKARSDAENVLQFSVEASVDGKELIGTGRTHRVTVPLTKEWKTWTFHWNDFSQSSYACPGDLCVGRLTVDKVSGFGWNPSEQSKEIDFWLDDVELLYEKQ